jgi:hypothetical protein
MHVKLKTYVGDNESILEVLFPNFFDVIHHLFRCEIAKKSDGRPGPGKLMIFGVRLGYFAFCGVKFQRNPFGPPGMDSLVQKLSIGTDFVPEFLASAWENDI